MILSHLIVRRGKANQERFAPGVFVGLVAAFALLGQSAPIVGLTGLGTTMVIAGFLVEFNRLAIWENYKKTYRKRKGITSAWTKPDPIYYVINVYVLWPMIILLGVTSLWAAYMLSFY